MATKTLSLVSDALVAVLTRTVIFSCTAVSSEPEFSALLLNNLRSSLLERMILLIYQFLLKNQNFKNILMIYWVDVRRCKAMGSSFSSIGNKKQ